MKKSTEIASRMIEERPEDERVWLFVVLVLAFGLLAWLNFRYPRKLRAQIDGFITNRHVTQLMREEGPGSQVPFGVLMGVSALAYGSFVYLVLNNYNIKLLDFEGSLLFTGICGALIVGFIIKTGVTRLLSFIVGEEQGVGEHVYNMSLFVQVSGIVLLPFVVAMAYMPEQFSYWAFVGGLAIVTITYVYRLLRGVQIGIAYKLSAFYLILYICTLEILPLVVAIKAFDGEF